VRIESDNCSPSSDELFLKFLRRHLPATADIQPIGADGGISGGGGGGNGNTRTPRTRTPGKSVPPAAGGGVSRSSPASGGHRTSAASVVTCRNAGKLQLQESDVAKVRGHLASLAPHSASDSVSRQLSHGHLMLCLLNE
jgi:hypothetical protein